MIGQKIIIIKPLGQSQVIGLATQFGPLGSVLCNSVPQLERTKNLDQVVELNRPPHHFDAFDDIGGQFAKIKKTADRMTGAASSDVMAADSVAETIPD
jgi:hypothetical protein